MKIVSKYRHKNNLTATKVSKKKTGFQKVTTVHKYWKLFQNNENFFQRETIVSLFQTVTTDSKQWLLVARQRQQFSNNKIISKYWVQFLNNKIAYKYWKRWHQFPNSDNNFQIVPTVSMQWKYFFLYQQLPYYQPWAWFPNSEHWLNFLAAVSKHWKQFSKSDTNVKTVKTVSKQFMNSDKSYQKVSNSYNC